MTCPICDGRLRPSFSTAQLVVRRCERCGHRVADHRNRGAAARDYHEQYDQGAFLTSLAATRRRQAALIVELIRTRLPDGDQVLDFGAGRGWFLDACREAGLQRLAGVDTSELAVRSLAERQFGAVVWSPATADYAAALRAIGFRPRVLTLLDVVEHFPAPQLRAQLTGILHGLQPGLELIVLKVPDAGGLLYRTARLMLAGGATAPMEQLYQVGTDPPHWNYFTQRSMRQLLESLGLRVIVTQGDRDFEAETLPQRAASLGRLPTIGRAAGGAATRLADLTGWHDAAIYLAAPIS